MVFVDELKGKIKQFLYHVSRINGYKFFTSPMKDTNPGSGITVIMLDTEEINRLLFHSSYFA